MKWWWVEAYVGTPQQVPDTGGFVTLMPQTAIFEPSGALQLPARAVRFSFELARLVGTYNISGIEVSEVRIFASTGSPSELQQIKSFGPLGPSAVQVTHPAQDGQCVGNVVLENEPYTMFKVDCRGRACRFINTGGATPAPGLPDGQTTCLVRMEIAYQGPGS